MDHLRSSFLSFLVSTVKLLILMLKLVLLLLVRLASCSARLHEATEQMRVGEGLLVQVVAILALTKG